MTEAKDQSDERQRKAAWMNDQLADRLAPTEQPGVGPAPDARPEDAFADAPRRATRTARAKEAADNK